MQTLNILNLFDNIIKCVKQPSGHYNLLDVNYDLVKNEIDSLSTHFYLTSSQLVLLAIIIDMCRYDSVTVEKLSEAIKCNFFVFLKLKKDIDELKSNDLIEGNKQISLSKELLASLENNEPYKLPTAFNMSTKAILEKLMELIENVKSKRKCPSSILKLMDRMILSNPYTSIAMVCDRYSILSYSSVQMEFTEDEIDQFFMSNKYSYTDAVSPVERILFYVSIFQSDDFIYLEDLAPFFMPFEFKELKDAYNQNALELQNRRIIDAIDENCFRLNPIVHSQAMADVAIDQNITKSYPNIKKAYDIKEKQLFYNPETERQIITLSSLLSKEKYTKIRASLLQQGLRTGFSTLFYGGPGTGKTESVYQLSRMTDRDIMAIEVSELKDQYVGESEKKIKEVFDNYRSYVSDYGTYPILLFNEADSVFGVRRSGATKAIDKMENSIQNIILQQMEDLDGILIATTNLIENLDRAFDRRFLYKVFFAQPNDQIRSLIWRSLIPEISKEDADALASEYKLSGAQIENISRKRIIQSVLTDSKITLNMIREWCNDEFISSLSSPEPNIISKLGFTLG